jgi:hypothetical protein
MEAGFGIPPYTDGGIAGSQGNNRSERNEDFHEA